MCVKVVKQNRSSCLIFEAANCLVSFLTVRSRKVFQRIKNYITTNVAHSPAHLFVKPLLRRPNGYQHRRGQKSISIGSLQDLGNYWLLNHIWRKSSTHFQLCGHLRDLQFKNVIYFHVLEVMVRVGPLLQDLFWNLHRLYGFIHMLLAPVS